MAQADPYTEIDVDPTQIKPDLFISIEPISQNQQKLTITILHEGYPMDVLRQQCEDIGKMLGTTIDIAEINATNLGTSTPLSLARAVIIVSGVLGPQPGEIQFESLFLPFLGLEEPFIIDSASLTIDNFQVSKFTLQDVKAGSVRGVGSYFAEQKRIEYRFVFLTQERNEVEIPSLVQEEITQESNQAPRAMFNPWLIPAATFVLIAVGGLVYFVWMRAKKA